MSEESELTAGDEGFSVHDQPGYERTYDEDETVSIRKGDLRALLDVATGSMDFGSGFWDEEQTEIARGVAAVLGIDPITVTPSNFVCKYRGRHNWHYFESSPYVGDAGWQSWSCHQCGAESPDRPEGAAEPFVARCLFCPPGRNFIGAYTSAEEAASPTKSHYDYQHKGWDTFQRGDRSELLAIGAEIHRQRLEERARRPSDVVFTTPSTTETITRAMEASD